MELYMTGSIWRPAGIGRKQGKQSLSVLFPANTGKERATDDAEDI